MRPTLQSVARLAGVSKSTASRALSGDPRVLPLTRDKVIEAARAVRYQPNEIARSLRVRQSGVLGVILNTYANEALARMAAVIQNKGAEAGFQVVTGVTDGDPEREVALLDHALRSRYEGVALMGTGRNGAQVSRMIQFGLPVVTLVRDVPGAATLHLRGAYRDAARVAVKHLHGRGHARIGFISCDESFSMGVELHRGFVEGIGLTGGTFGSDLVRLGPFSPDFGHAAALHILDADPDASALVVGNVDALHGVRRAMWDRGLRAPDDLSIICLEEAQALAWSGPAVTVVDPRPDQLAATAFDWLAATLALRSSGAESDDQSLPPVPDAPLPELIDRETVGAPRPSITTK